MLNPPLLYCFRSFTGCYPTRRHRLQSLNSADTPFSLACVLQLFASRRFVFSLALYKSIHPLLLWPSVNDAALQQRCNIPIFSPARCEVASTTPRLGIYDGFRETRRSLPDVVPHFQQDVSRTDYSPISPSFFPCSSALVVNRITPCRSLCPKMLLTPSSRAKLDWRCPGRFGRCRRSRCNVECLYCIF